MRPSRFFPLRAITAAAALACLPARATVDDAHSAALEAAQSAVEDGFKIRQEYWKGKVTSGQQKMVKHQLFKDSTVWFWLGTADPAQKIEIEIYDAKGVKVASEKKSGNDFAALKLTPPKTGTYLIVFRITGQPDEQQDWALVYGWK